MNCADIQGIDEVSFAVLDLPRSKSFFLDWGLRLVAESDTRLEFVTLNDCRVIATSATDTNLPPGIEPDPTLRQVVWAVRDAAALANFSERMRDQPGFWQTEGRVGCTDPNGLSIAVQVSQKKNLTLQPSLTNAWGAAQRIDQAAPIYDRAEPIEVGHVVFFVSDLAACSAFYSDVLGFVVSDQYPNRGHFMRCSKRGGHHDLFLLQPPVERRGLNHVAFTVRDLHEVIGGGMHMSRCGWQTELGPGRHPISSAMFWYFNSPTGGLFEYYIDEDQLTENWTARSFEPGPTVFAEWAIAGGIDGHTRRQIQAEAPKAAFMTDKPRSPSP